MNNAELKKIWAKKYDSVTRTLKDLEKIKAVATAFNTNIDAVFKIKGKKLRQLIEQENLPLKNLQDIRDAKLDSGKDVLKGIFRCFERGIAEEWLTEKIDVYDWLTAYVGYDRLQMGGQAGIISNALGIAGIPKVYVHCNSLPKMQAEVFLKCKNLVSFDTKGKEAPAYMIDRSADLPLIHWIIEFDKGDILEINGEKIVCPKSNRFIATYDPLNLKLVMDENFVKKMAEKKPDVIILSGYHALTSKNKGEKLIATSIPVVKSWKKESAILHLEIASTQDMKIRKAIVNKVSPIATSVGINERETIDILKVIGEKKLASVIEKQTDAIRLFQGLLKMKQKLGCPRIQLHMFGLYLILQDKNFKISPKQALKGMALAATAAAGKASVGDLNMKKNILATKGKDVSDIGLNELKNLADFLKSEELLNQGFTELKDYWLIAMPTIIVDKPLTLVGMGDTISSFSLVGSL